MATDALELKRTRAYKLGYKRTLRSTSSSSKNETEVSASLWLEKKKALFAGNTKGVITIWKSKSKYDHSIVKVHLTGHLGQIFSLLHLSDHGPPGQGLVMSCSADRTIRVWDPFTRDLEERCIQTLTGHEGSVTGMCLVKGFVLSTSTDGKVKVWIGDPNRSLMLYPWFLCLQTIEVDGHVPCSLGALIRSTDTESTAVFVGDDKGNIHTLVPKSSLYQLVDSKANTIAMMGVGVDKDVEVFRYLWNQELMSLHKLSITSVMVIHTEQLIVTAGFDCTLQAHEITGNTAFSIENERKVRYMGMCWNQSTRELIVVDAAGYIQFWNIYMEKCLKSIQISNSKLLSVKLTAEDTLCITSTDDVMMWKILRSTEFREIGGHSDAISGMCCADFGDEHLYSISADMTVRCWDVYDMTCLSMLREQKSEFSSLLFLPGSLILVTGHDDGSIKLWNTDSGSSVELKQHSSSVSGIAYAHTEKRDYLVSCSFDRTLAIWDVTKRRAFTPLPEYVFQASSDELLCVKYHAPTGYIVTAGTAAEITVWELETRELKFSLKGHTDPVTCLAIDGNFLISAGDDMSLRVWDLTFGFQVFCQDRLHQAPIRDVLVIPQTGRVISLSDYHVCVFDYTQKEVIKTYTNRKEFTCLFYHAMEKMLFAGTSDGTLLNFEFPDGKVGELWSEEQWVSMAEEIKQKAKRNDKSKRRRYHGRRGSVSMMDATNFTSFTLATPVEDVRDTETSTTTTSITSSSSS